MFGVKPFGAAPFGWSPDHSLVSPVGALLAGEVPIVEHLVRIQPYDSVSGARVDLRISGGGYGSLLGDTLPTGEAYARKYFYETLIAPLNREARYVSGGLISRDPAANYGEIVFGDALREFTSWLAYRWEGAPVTSYQGAPDWALASYATTFRGDAVRMEPKSDRMSVYVADLIQRLQRDVNPEIFAGQGPCLRLNGSSSYGSAAVTAPAGSMTMEVSIRPATSASADKALANWRNGSGAGLRLLYFRAGTANNPVFAVRNDAGTVYEVIPATSLPAGSISRLAGVLDTTAAQIRLLVNGVLVGTTAVAGTFNTVLSTFVVGKLADTSSLWFDGDMDEIRIWNKARTAAEVLADMNRELVGNEANLYTYYKCNEYTASTAYNSIVTRANLTLTSTAWADSLTGTPALAGKRIPRSGGYLAQVPCLLLNEVDQIYLVTGGSFIALSALEDKGLVRWTLKGDYTDPYATTLAAGEYLTCKNLGLVRVGSKPDGVLTATFQASTATSAGALGKALCLGPGGLLSTEVDEGAFDALHTSHSAPAGWYAGLEPKSVDACLVSTLLGNNAGRYTDLDGRVTVSRLPSSASSIATLTGDDLAIDGYETLSTLDAARAVTIRYRHYETTQTEDALHASLSIGDKQDRGQEWREYTTAENAAVVAANPSARVLVFETSLYNFADAQVLGEELAAYHSVPRTTGLWPLLIPRHQYAMGQTVTIQAAVANYDAGRVVVITGVRRDDSLGRHALEVTG